MTGKKLLLIDHRDSFTWNIAEYLRRAGVDFSVADYHLFSPDMMPDYTHFILSPGPGIPSAYSYFESFMKEIDGRPVLGICLGHQLLAEFAGGRLRLLNKPAHGEPRVINVRKSVLFASLPASFQVGLYHSWTVDPRKMPEEFHVIATDARGNIMAMEHKKFPYFGVQFHPESYISEFGTEIFKNFLKC